jgi:hypothetical protein
MPRTLDVDPRLGLIQFKEGDSQPKGIDISGFTVNVERKTAVVGMETLWLDILTPSPDSRAKSETLAQKLNNLLSGSSSEVQLRVREDGLGCAISYNPRAYEVNFLS